MPNRCLICNTAGAACGTPTVGVVEPVDARITGVRVAGDKVMPNIPPLPDDMDDETRDEYQMMVAALGKKSLRQQLHERTVNAMADGKAPHTSLSYVDRGDGILIKMHPDVAKQYVELHEDAEIVREGALPIPEEGEIIGATKATVGQMFDENGRQKEEIQPITSRTFSASDRTSTQAVRPAVGTSGAADNDVNTGTGSMTSSATSGESTPAKSPSGAASNTPRSPRITKPDDDDK